MRWQAARALAGLMLAIGLGACASNPPPAPVVTVPKFPSYPAPSIPATLAVAPDLRERHDVAWRRLQVGDLRGASRDFAAVLKSRPDFYPAEAAMGFVHLADRQFKQAAARFSAALDRDNQYLPAWVGQMEAQLGLENDPEAIVAMERVLALDPTRAVVRSRLELVRFRQIQTLIESGRDARQAGRLDAARQALGDALALSPTSTMILRELALVETASGRLDQAEAHLRRAIELEPGEPEAHAALAQVLESRGEYREAAAAYSRAAAFDPRPAWRSAAAALIEKADLAALPPEFGDLPGAATISRAHVAAYVGIKLGRLIESAPQRPTTVATDVRSHWASPWILPVTRAGVMSVFANHTFQPGATVLRGDLAQVASQLIALAASDRPAELAAWRAARPQFPDLPSSNVNYRAAALAVTVSAMAVDADGRFRATQPATGLDLTRLVARVDEMAAR